MSKPSQPVSLQLYHLFPVSLSQLITCYVTITPRIHHSHPMLNSTNLVENHCQANCYLNINLKTMMQKTNMSYLLATYHWHQLPNSILHC